MIERVLDTDTCNFLISKKPSEALARLQTLEIETVGISSVTLSELEYGVARSARPDQDRIALAQFVAPLEILPYDDQAAAQYGPMRATL